MNPAKPSGWLLLLAWSACLALVFLVIRGGWGLGLALAVPAVQAVFFAYLFLPPVLAGTEMPEHLRRLRSVAGRRRLLIPAVLMLLLGLCCLISDNPMLRLLNILMILLLLTVQLLLAAQTALDWDKPLFWVEICLAGLVRPLVCLPDFCRGVAGLLRRRASVTQDAPAKPADRQWVLPVLLGLLITAPILLLLAVLLSAADPVFGHWLGRCATYLASLKLHVAWQNILLAGLLTPFAVSVLHSGRSGWRIPFFTEDPVAGAARQSSQMLRIILIVLLSGVNLLYLAFAAVQAAYLTGAFARVLPAGLTYAEYARSGFFELAFVGLLNLALLLPAVRASRQPGRTGRVIRAECLLLLAGSAVQLASALFRMRMYTLAFGLTRLRFFVFAFLLLTAVLLAILLLRVFRARLPLFKSLSLAVVVALLLLNLSLSDAWIARHNVRRHQAGATEQALDTAYFRLLSLDAVPAMLELLDDPDPVLAREIAAQLKLRYDLMTHPANGRTWQDLTWSGERAVRLIFARLDDIQALLNLSPAVRAP